MLKNVADAVLKELGIENDVPFQVNEWGNGLWIKVTDGVGYWDAGGNRVSWCEDTVLLRQLMDGTLTVRLNTIQEFNIILDFTSTSIVRATDIEKIRRFINTLYNDIVWEMTQVSCSQVEMK